MSRFSTQLRRMTLSPIAVAFVLVPLTTFASRRYVGFSSADNISSVQLFLSML